MRIEVTDFHWLGKIAERDLCLHGKVAVEISGILIDPPQMETTISAMGLFLLRTLTQNYREGNGWHNWLLPCCGHYWYLNDNANELENGNMVVIEGCNSGFEWNIEHKDNLVIHTYDNLSEKMSLIDWRRSVLDVCAQIEEFYRMSSPKILDQDERLVWDRFWEEWQNRKLTSSST